MAEKVTIRACPYCGSMDTHPALLFGGPLPWVDHNDGGYVCRNCGKTAVPLDFDTLDELRAFQRSLSRGEEDTSQSFYHIPILPVDTFTLFRIPVIDLPIGQIADVTEAEWINGRIEPVGQKAKFNRYWRAVDSPRYSAKEIALWDLSGIRDGHPNFEVLKKLVRSKYQIWLDLGMRSVQDVFDSFTMDVSRGLIGTLTAPDLELFEEAFELTDRAVPCIHYDRKVLWPSRRSGPEKLEKAVAELIDIGYEEIGVIDLPRLGKRNGPDADMLTKLEQLDADFILGGGITEADIDQLRASGMRGAFMDPFTPVIGDLLEEEERTLPSESFTTARRPAASGRPAPAD